MSAPPHPDPSGFSAYPSGSFGAQPAPNGQVDSRSARSTRTLALVALILSALVLTSLLARFLCTLLVQFTISSVPAQQAVLAVINVVYLVTIAITFAVIVLDIILMVRARGKVRTGALISLLFIAGVFVLGGIINRVIIMVAATVNADVSAFMVIGLLSFLASLIVTTGSMVGNVMAYFAARQALTTLVFR